MNIKTRKAFSLVETMLVALISTIAFAGIYSTFIVGNRAWVYYNDSVVVKKEVRRALIGMVNELREAQNVRVIQSSDGSAIHFYKPTLGTVSYVWSTKGNNAYKIMKYSRLGTRILAQHISSLSFEHTKDAVAINISARKQESSPNRTQAVLREKIALRLETAMFTR